MDEDIRIIGKSPHIKDLLDFIKISSNSDDNILILGDTGVGKELAARNIHLHSHRKEYQFIKINCANLNENLLESELFGHKRGAFTGAVDNRTGLIEEASHGTFFFDEIGDLPLFYFAARFYAGGIRRVSKEVMEKWAVLSRRIQDSLSGVDVVKIFSAEERETNSIHNHLEDLKRSDIKQNIISSFSSEFMSLIGALGGFVVLWFGGINIIKGTFTIGGYIAFTGYLAKLYGPTQSIAMQGLSFQPAITALNRVSEFSSIAQEEEDPDRKINIKGINRIEFKNVTFSYGKKKALENINLTINKNDKVLITGPNGSGKSTMVKLILGLYKIKQGKLFINNQDINNISLSSLRDKISFVSQNVFLFNDTIRNNILYSKPEASAEEVEKAAKLSGSSDFINKLDEKMDVIVGETGRMISGGEKQKISIARAILKDSDVVIFDEATSQQDAQSIERIESLIEKRFKDKICIIISHRSIKNLKLTKIIRLKEGSIR